MSNSMKLIVRTLIIVLLMILGAWLNSILDSKAAQTDQLAPLAFLAMYAVYFCIGIALSTTVSHRFTKNNRYVYLFPIFIFIVIGVAPLLYSMIPLLPFPWIVSYLSKFSYLSWALTGTFIGLAFR